MPVNELKEYLKDHWSEIREQLLKGHYNPQPVKQVLIPKPGGGTRMLGIPTAVDRLIQQALLQVLNPIYDPTCSRHSYGFRPCRNAHQALKGVTYQIKKITRRSRGISPLQIIKELSHYLRGWLAYYRLI